MCLVGFARAGFKTRPFALFTELHALVFGLTGCSLGHRDLDLAIGHVNTVGTKGRILGFWLFCGANCGVGFLERDRRTIGQVRIGL